MSDGLNDNESTTDKRLPFINYIPSHRNSERDNSSELFSISLTLLITKEIGIEMRNYYESSISIPFI